MSGRPCRVLSATDRIEHTLPGSLNRHSYSGRKCPVRWKFHRACHSALHQLASDQGLLSDMRNFGHFHLILQKSAADPADGRRSPQEPWVAHCGSSWPEPHMAVQVTRGCLYCNEAFSPQANWRARLGQPVSVRLIGNQREVLLRVSLCPMKHRPEQPHRCLIFPLEQEDFDLPWAN